MENKYYTPELEEFYVGFEYEVLRKSPTTEEWVKFIFPKYPRVGVEWGTQDPYNIVGRLTHRVKYIDKEDIESLGCIQDTNNIYWYTYNNHVFNYSDVTNWMNVWIKDTFYSPGRTAVFSGIVKNKSEFKKLIKQLDLDLTHRNKFETDWSKINETT